jgi:hypothetical protein
MKFDAAEITKFVRDTGFPADNLEKVLRLRELLAELHKYTFLQGKLVLKGGTALNLFYLDLKRLSVDIDRTISRTSIAKPHSENAPRSSRPVEQMDPWCTPTGILSAHLADQISDLTGNDRSSRMAVPYLPGPENTKALAMPGHDRFGLDDGQRRAPVAPDAGEPDP